MPKAQPISLPNEFSALRFLADRTPQSTDDDKTGAFARLSEYRDGGMFIGHFAGTSEWERHASGDEIVFVVEGAARLYLDVDGREVEHRLEAGELLVVPEGTWHRFVVPDSVKVLTVTPQPTDHSPTRPQKA